MSNGTPTADQAELQATLDLLLQAQRNQREAAGRMRGQSDIYTAQATALNEQAATALTASGAATTHAATLVARAVTYERRADNLQADIDDLRAEITPPAPPA